MIKVYHWDMKDLGDEDYQENIRNLVSYKLTDNGDTITFNVKVPFKRESREFGYILDIAANKGRVMELMVIETSEAAEVKALYSYDYVDRQNGYNIPAANGADRTKIARVVIDDDGNVFIVPAYYCDDIEGFDNITMEAGVNATKYYLMRDCEWYAERVNVLDKKKELIKQTDIYRSAGYLEAQVDLLTRMVIALAGGKTDEGCLELLETADKYSVLNIKSADAIEKEFTVNKANFRVLQEKYYEEIE